jgi:pyruvate/2-oxoglutarate dehydrogenase complex dihydrolipoamide acyltransferase (E2) component
MTGKEAARSTIVRPDVDGIFDKWRLCMGDRVLQGQTIAEVKVGRRRHFICAPCSGILGESDVETGDPINGSTILCRIEPALAVPKAPLIVPEAQPSAPDPANKPKPRVENESSVSERSFSSEDLEADQANAILQSGEKQDKRHQAFERLRQLAEEGSAIAQFHLGEWHYEGTEEDEKGISACAIT